MVWMKPTVGALYFRMALQVDEGLSGSTLHIARLAHCMHGWQVNTSTLHIDTW